ncbi:IclR family transcriptional regulator [Rhizobium sp. CNPSo 3968]|uniref:IclR family transcriptional regulator n=1 Tax=Rhizobium sp. CNPSo 3968 TaxID=3021408 RepID=UPI00254E2F28|nr:IclR family transcriptional regulator [Rhizobium sp. CNPSo 3968]MDK4717838.1 IclR family transcriptional regulator [Rhizobium sp. CNPSo 3968]
MAKSALRVLEIMEFVATCQGGATHAEISVALGIPKSSLTELLRDLQRPGYLQLDKQSGRFSIGSQIMFLTHSYIKNLNIVRVGSPFVHQLFLSINEYTTMAIPKGDEVVVVCSETLPSPLSHSLNLGEHLPMLSSAVGRAVLAFMDEHEQEGVFERFKPTAYTPLTNTSLESIKKALAHTRETGIADVRDEYRLGIIGLAAPVFNVNGKPIASIGVALPSARQDLGYEEGVKKILLECTSELSRSLGANLTASPRSAFRDPEDPDVRELEGIS